MTRAPSAGATRGDEQLVNLPNAISAGRIVLSPLVALLPLLPSAAWRAVAFALFLVTAVSDYWDGWYARTRGLITDLGKTLDPLADKLFVVATFLPMLILQGPPTDPVAASLAGVLPMRIDGAFAFPFATWFGPVALPWWVLAVVISREVFMTVFRQVAQRRGVVIAAIRSAKWKAGFQFVWVGAAYFWFGIETLATRRHWAGAGWDAIAQFIGVIGVVSMAVAFLLAVYSLALYVRRYGAMFAR